MKTSSILSNACANVTYTPNLIGREKGSAYLERLSSNVPWQSEVARGRKVGRKVCAFGDHGLAYRYAGGVKKAHPWTSDLVELKRQVEQATGKRFNFVLLNKYESGKEGIGYHADDMRDAIPDAEIASVTLGEERDFLLKPYSEEAKTRGLVDTKKIRLAHGSLLCMKDNTQEHYKHSLPARPKQSGVRINLTFRQLRDPNRRGGFD
jgi:alkylated DNA repair dioxygenase AlkB